MYMAVNSKIRNTYIYIYIYIVYIHIYVCIDFLPTRQLGLLDFVMKSTPPPSPPPPPSTMSQTNARQNVSEKYQTIHVNSKCRTNT